MGLGSYRTGDLMQQLAAYPPVTEELLQEVVRRILAAGSPERVILFGSHARGDTHPYSDLDLLIIEESDQPRSGRCARYAKVLAGVYPERDVVAWTPEEVSAWADVPNAFITTALREGRALYSRPDSTPAPPIRQAPVQAERPGVPRRFSMIDLTRGWLLKGRSDLISARTMIAGAGPYDTACFHAQQAVEKFLKAIVAHAGKTIPKTHNLIDLWALCLAHAPALDGSGIDLNALHQFAVRARYDFDFWPERSVAEGVLEMADRVHRAVLAVLPPEADPPATPPGED